ncbi:glutamine amidotransferase [Halomonas dongshanensis]|uniref:Glutamine amidotransferase n=1 Tax=Halomonas dongshanensis TaxID=2890835 RepID=A0ABT2EDE6_9GAMM|nr:glutamine amidotransferase [Halomonas dongshanensis]MCS2609597.1 glutamine amidotransferase [Halomonas dongshanensis]
MPFVLIVKTGDAFADVVSQYGDFDALFRAPLEAAAPKATVSVWDARHQAAPTLDGIDAIVITGSHSMVSDAEPWSEALKPWLREAKRRDIALLGVCYGHQLMAAAFGGVSDYHPAGRESGTFELNLTREGQEDALFGALPTTFAANLTHAQAVLQAPTGAEVLAYNAHDPHQALRYGPRQWSVQFHPEFGAGVMGCYLAHQRDALAEQGEDVQALIDGVRATPEATGLLARFVTLL